MRASKADNFHCGVNRPFNIRMIAFMLSYPSRSNNFRIRALCSSSSGSQFLLHYVGPFTLRMWQQQENAFNCHMSFWQRWTASGIVSEGHLSVNAGGQLKDALRLWDTNLS